LNGRGADDQPPRRRGRHGPAAAGRHSLTHSHRGGSAADSPRRPVSCLRRTPQAPGSASCGDHDSDGTSLAGRQLTVTAPANRAVPPSVLRVVDGRPARVAWENRRGGITCEVGTGADRCFVKWAPAGRDAEIGAEAARLAWALPFTPVPQLISHGNDETGSWLVTAALDGENAAAPRWRAKPQVAVERSEQACAPCTTVCRRTPARSPGPLTSG
jgi:hypothetical protein